MDNVQSADVCTSGGWDCYFERISSCDDHDLGGGIFVQLGLPKHEDNRVLYVWALGGRHTCVSYAPHPSLRSFGHVPPYAWLRGAVAVEPIRQRARHI